MNRGEFFCSCEKGGSRGCGFYMGVGKDFQPKTFRVLERDKREFVEGSWLDSLIWDPHVLLPFQFQCFHSNTHTSIFL